MPNAYLRHFRISVTLGADARQKCRHPLLRFFCEAHARPDGAGGANLWHVEEIRIKPLFDDYWRNKMDQVLALLLMTRTPHRQRPASTQWCATCSQPARPR